MILNVREYAKAYLLLQQCPEKCNGTIGMLGWLPGVKNPTIQSAFKMGQVAARWADKEDGANRPPLGAVAAYLFCLN